MRREAQTSVIRVRASETLLASAERRAAMEGVSLSELVRSALRRELRQAA